MTLIQDILQSKYVIYLIQYITQCERKMLPVVYFALLQGERFRATLTTPVHPLLKVDFKFITYPSKLSLNMNICLIC